MITLDVKDFCQNCPDFEAEVRKTQFYDRTDTHITCMDIEKCYSAFRKGQNAERSHEEVTP